MPVGGRTYQLGCTGLRSIPVTSILVSLRHPFKVAQWLRITFRFGKLIALDMSSQCQNPNISSRPYQHPSPKFLRTEYTTH